MSWADPHAGLRAKIKRAQHHMQFLDTEVQAWLRRDPHAIHSEIDADSGSRIFTYFELESPPLEWAVIIGEFVHDLRSALDHIIYAMTIANGSGPLWGTSFPIFDCKADFFETDKRTGKPTYRSGQHAIRGLPAEARVFVIGQQPYHRDDPSSHALGVLHDLWNRDKHRLLHVMPCTAIDTNIEVSGFNGLAHPMICLGEVEDGATMGWLRFTEPSPDVKVDAQFRFAIMLEQQGPEGGLLTTLNWLFDSTLAVLKPLMLRLGYMVRTDPPTLGWMDPEVYVPIPAHDEEP